MPEFLIELLSISALCIAVIGFVIGSVGGAIPGVNIVLTMTLLIPFTLEMSPTQTVILLISCYVGGEYSGSIPAILINTPGTPSAAAVVFDGYPMAQRGEGAKAIGISATASTVGNFIGAFFLLALAPVLTAFVLIFGTAEYFLLAVLGLATISSAASGTLRRALTAAVLGALLATVGASTLSANPRFTLGVDELYDGIPLTAAFIGVFAIGEMIRLAGKQGAIAEKLAAGGGRVEGFRAAMRAWPSMVRGGLIGIFVGVIPGQGGAVANMLAYTAEKQSSKDPDSFGKGNPAGIAGPESANNAVIGGALVPTIGLGIPGSGSTAVIVTALLLQGIRPGPQLFETEMVLVQVIIGTVLIGGILTFLFGFGLAKPLSYLSSIPLYALVPSVIAISLLGTFAGSFSSVSVWIAVVLGVVGYFLIRYNYSPVAFVLGLILGPLAEENLARLIQLTDGRPWEQILGRPASLVLVALIVLALAQPSWLRWRQARRTAGIEVTTGAHGPE